MQITFLLLESLENFQLNDYVQEEEVGFKKPKACAFISTPF